ncbi:MAG: hypothetical protein OXC19_03375 [Bryobacterales bacterium]|nr:hypothetical protein [Bryobacterales bacterium]
MELDQSASHPESPGAVAGDPLEELERRVLAMAEAYKAARLARRDAEAEANALRNQLQERDMQIVLLKKQVEGDDLRTTVRARVESLLKRIDELEREG